MQRESSLNFSDVHVNNLVPQDSNPNVMSDAEFGRLKSEIQEVGFIVPIIVASRHDSADSFTIINGHHRWMAAKELGYEFIPCVILYDDKYKDPEFVELLNLRINNIHGSLDHLKLLPIYQKNLNKYGAEKMQELFGIANNTYWKRTKKQMEKYLASSGLSESQRAEIMAEVELNKSPEVVQKKLAKALKTKLEKSETQTMVFMSGGKENIAIPLPPDLFKIVKALHLKCQEEQMDLAQVLREPIVDTYRLISGDQGLQV